MNAPSRSSNGNCPNCGSSHWKTLEALHLFHRQATKTVTTGARADQRRATAGTAESMAAARYAPPVRPTDYGQADDYRKSLNDVVRDAEQRLAEIDAASGAVSKLLPGLFTHGPEARELGFNRYARKLERLTSYDADLARWNATRLCLRCATQFTNVDLPPPVPSLTFRFAGQERKCSGCGSYFWKDPEAVGKSRVWDARQDWLHARETVEQAEADARRAQETRPQPTGWIDKLKALVRRRPLTVPEALAKLAQAEAAYVRTESVAADLRQFKVHNPRGRWCAGCESTYVCPEPSAE